MIFEAHLGAPASRWQGRNPPASRRRSQGGFIDRQEGHLRVLIAILVVWFSFGTLRAEDGYRLWLRYDKIEDPALRENYSRFASGILAGGSSPACAAIREELNRGL